MNICNNRQNVAFKKKLNYLFDNEKLYLIELFVLYNNTNNFKHNIVIKINTMIQNFLYIEKILKQKLIELTICKKFDRECIEKQNRENIKI